MWFYSHKYFLTSVPFFMSIMYGVSAVAVRALLSLYQRYVAGGTLSLSLQWSSSPEPTNTELGTSQDGTWGGTERARWKNWWRGVNWMQLKGRILWCKTPKQRSEGANSDRAQELSSSGALPYVVNSSLPCSCVHMYIHTGFPSYPGRWGSQRPLRDWRGPR